MDIYPFLSPCTSLKSKRIKNIHIKCEITTSKAPEPNFALCLAYPECNNLTGFKKNNLNLSIYFFTMIQTSCYTIQLFVTLGL